MSAMLHHHHNIFLCLVDYLVYEINLTYYILVVIITNPSPPLPPFPAFTPVLAEAPPPPPPVPGAPFPPLPPFPAVEPPPPAPPYNISMGLYKMIPFCPFIFTEVFAIEGKTPVALNPEPVPEPPPPPAAVIKFTGVLAVELTVTPATEGCPA